MMKLRLFLRSLARLGLNLIILASLICGCSTSTSPTYLKENIPEAISDICKKEYNIDAKVVLVGSTLWIYLPLEDLFEKSNKPQKYTERFSIEDNKTVFQDKVFKVGYKIKTVKEVEKSNAIKYTKEASDKIHRVTQSIYRVILSSDNPDKNSPRFFRLITADIKNGFETIETFYYFDLKKYFYGLISGPEYQHRSLYDTFISDSIMQDKVGKHLTYKDIAMEEFIAKQIEGRIRLKFEKPEVNRNADIDKEIQKIAILALKIYSFKDFSEVELNNLLTEYTVILNRSAVLQSPID